MRGWRRVLILVFAALFVPGAVDSCGPFYEMALFTTYHGTFPGEFAAGNFGVLRPHFNRADLLMAYRMLSGVMVSAGETPGPLRDVGVDWNRAKPWLDVRNKIPGVPPLREIDGDKKVPGADYEVYPNCLPGAFNKAAEVLGQRVARWGAGSIQVAEWVRGQDAVFQNCAGGPVIPARLKPGTDRLLVADREYQIAAAQFYAGQFAAAEAGFDAIALDRESPWHDIAPYVAARVCIRRGTVGKDEGKLREAGARLRAIEADPQSGVWRAPAREMLGFVMARLDPEKRLAELGKQIMQPRQGAALQRMITDYTRIWDSMETAGQHPSPAKSEVSDWITTFRQGWPQGVSAVEQWRAKPTLPWLVAALVWVKGPSAAEMGDLLAAAHAVKPESPGYATATYYGILQQIRAGDADAARQWADAALSRKGPPALTNLFRSERLYLAQDWVEFLRFAPRTPVASMLEGGGLDDPLPGSQGPQKRPVLDEDASASLNRAVPLRLWNDAAQNSLLPRPIRAEIAQAGWVRAVILGNQEEARAQAGHLRLLTPALRAAMDVYLAESDPAAANFSAIFLMLRAPGFEPQLRSGWGRPAPVMERAMLSDNWWTLPGMREDLRDNAEHQALLDLYPDGRWGPRAFLPADQQAAGKAEWERLVKRAGNSVNYLCEEAVAWAEAHPQDARVPQALHLAVVATRYGPADLKSKAWSKRAFTLLHLRYSKSPWAAETKYWY